MMWFLQFIQDIRKLWLRLITSITCIHFLVGDTAMHIMRIRTCVYFLRFNHDHGTIFMYETNV
ncbi:hypothetical protein BDV24DRAFT_141385 [Aspergillus arachidicola]|uniref:Uncharacterized protein n=1 Tax=Aspergillus arachidicola TaxID=656916 RepID=A0A5N6XTZ7_9EURO|nr:hypothetical protein BDV24DRAFT_141385 [Aspergillus arachidicola]